MFKLQQIIRANMGELAKSITSEQGKTLIDAEGDVLRGLRKLLFFEKLLLYIKRYTQFVEVVEHMCSITSLQMGEVVPNIAKDMDTYSHTLPLGESFECNLSNNREDLLVKAGVIVLS